MNRQIKFRSKRLDNGEWIYGDLIHIDKSEIGIVTDYDHWQGCRVDPETVGQFIGLLDRNGKEIYEGDIIRIDSHSWLDWKEFDGVNAEIVYDNGTFEARWKNPDAGKPYPFQNPDDEEDVEAEYVCEFIGNLPNTIEVIGSIHDTPDLLNGK